MSALIWSLSTPLVAPAVCACAACFLAWLGWRRFVRAVERRLNVTAGAE